jgi:hypothetical protein
MIKLAADENFNNDIVRGLLRRKPELDIVRIQSPELAALPWEFLYDTHQAEYVCLSRTTLATL